MAANKLPQEVVDLVCDMLEEDAREHPTIRTSTASFSSMRLVNNTWSESALRHLFYGITIKLSDDNGIRELIKLVNVPYLVPHIKRVTIEPGKAPNSTDPDADFYQAPVGMLSQVFSRLDNLTSLVIEDQEQYAAFTVYPTMEDTLEFWTAAIGCRVFPHFRTLIVNDIITLARFENLIADSASESEDTSTPPTSSQHSELADGSLSASKSTLQRNLLNVQIIRAGTSRRSGCRPFLSYIMRSLIQGTSMQELTVALYSSDRSKPPTLPASAKKPGLRRLDVHNVRCIERELKSFLSHFEGTLESLRLSAGLSAGLSSERWGNIFIYLRDRFPRLVELRFRTDAAYRWRKEGHWFSGSPEAGDWPADRLSLQWTMRLCEDDVVDYLALLRKVDQTRQSFGLLPEHVEDVAFLESRFGKSREGFETTPSSTSSV